MGINLQHCSDLSDDIQKCPHTLADLRLSGHKNEIHTHIEE
jgi:hypothetical protein